mmetsp:Transcript_129499/g.322792  ORF Transcript_129499/g.322792 Transcript_129499/m.322792 type:complete len:295 (+) Transcript_129499:4391-5275(+)
MFHSVWARVPTTCHRDNLGDRLTLGGCLPDQVADAMNIVRILIKVIPTGSNARISHLGCKPVREEAPRRHGDGANPDTNLLVVVELAKANPGRIQLPQCQLDDVEGHAWHHSLCLTPDVIAQEADLAALNAICSARAGGLPLCQRPKEDPDPATGLDHGALAMTSHHLEGQRISTLQLQQIVVSSQDLEPLCLAELWRQIHRVRLWDAPIGIQNHISTLNCLIRPVRDIIHRDELHECVLEQVVGHILKYVFDVGIENDLVQRVLSKPTFRLEHDFQFPPLLGAVVAPEVAAFW